MAVDLMESVRRMLTPDVVANAADTADEAPDTARKALNGAVPTIFAGLAHSAAATGGAPRVFSVLTEGGNTGQGLMSKVFGERAGAVTDALASSAGTKSSSASRLLAFAFPLVAGVLGKQIVSNGLNPGGLAQKLLDEKKAILDDPNTPPGLAGALGLGSLSELGGSALGIAEPQVRTAAAPVPTAVERNAPVVERSAATRRRAPWGAIISALVLLGGLAIWALAAPGHADRAHVGVAMPQPVVPTVTTPPTEAPRPGTSAAPAAEPRSAENPAMATIVLPGGKTLDLEASSSEVGLANALRDPAIALPQTFQLSGLNFESGTATVTSDSSKTLDDLTAILAAYPSSRVRIEGHTDSVGNPAVNQPLSRSRADAVKEMLVSRGISSYRIETAGNREQGSVADNDAEEGRSRNRRADLVLINR